MFRSLCRLGSTQVLLFGWFLFLAPPLSAHQSELGIAPRRSALPGAATSQVETLLAQGRRDERFQKPFEQWQHMNPDEKETIRRRMDQWNQMDPQDRRRYQERFNQWKGLSQEEQSQIDRKLDNWRDLSPAEKEDVKKRFR
jgi:hypothetical protein